MPRKRPVRIEFESDHLNELRKGARPLVAESGGDATSARVTRAELTRAASVICPKQAELVPKLLSATDLWTMAMREAFIKNLSGKDVEILRAGLKQVSEDGHIE